MELPTSLSLYKLSRVCPSLCFQFPTSPFNSHRFNHRKFRKRLNCYAKPIRVELNSEMESSAALNVNQGLENGEGNGTGYLWDDSEFVEVIGIGSRKDAVLDFCMASPFVSPSLRFWNILANNSVKVQLEQRLVGKDITPRIVEALLTTESCSKVLILVASAGYGSDYMTVLDILKTVKSTKGLVVGIILKPFSFEGRRRQGEVKLLVEKIQMHTSFCIVVDTDALLEKDLVTLDEALKTANNAILMALNAISVLTSELNLKFLDILNNNTKEVQVSEIMKILGKYKEGKIGFGAGYNIKTSILHAIYDCPFLGVGVKDWNGGVVCILSSSGAINGSQAHSIIQTFRQTTDCKGEIIISITDEPNMEPNLIVATVITLGYAPHETSQESSIFSRLAQRFPFLYNLLGKNHRQYDNNDGNSSPENICSEPINSPDSDVIATDDISQDIDIYSAEVQTFFSNGGDETHSFRDYNISSVQSEGESSEADYNSSTAYDPNTEGPSILHGEPLTRRILGDGYQIAQEVAEEGVNDSVATSMLDNLISYKLPVGVRPLEELENSPTTLNFEHRKENVTEYDVKTQPEKTSSLAWDSLDVVTDSYNNASASLKENYANVPEKQGVLSTRAASMLESERNSQKKWNPIMKIKYRGGIYRGRCQGGLPEGKGRLLLGDGSMYDGMWRYGKRSGPGTFYFSNGDVFQGSWRDDVMHGKGWFYFHNGDRWFVNFWKGKANGEGRFYSKNGAIFFGHFKDGWRHGHFLCINVDGTRCIEVWDKGVLVSHKQMDPDATGTV